MAVGNFARSELYTDINRKAASITNIDRLVNRAVQFVIGDMDLRSTKRRAYLSPYINNEQFDYQAPADLKGWSVVDLRRLNDRKSNVRFKVVPTEEFDRLKKSGGLAGRNLIAIEESDFLKKIRVTTEESASQATLHACDDIDADGTWAASGSASNLTEDTDNYVEGAASLNFDIAASYTSALLTNPDFTAIDISDYETGGSVFVRVWIPSTTGLTSFKLRVGSSASAYFERTVTVTNENLAFHTGWVMLRFDFNAATETGTVDMDNIDYLRLEVVGDGTAAATTDWRIDHVVARRGIPHELIYYTKYGWQSSAGAYLEESTAATDLINCDTDEYMGFVFKGKEFVALDLKQFDEVKEYRKLYQDWKNEYLIQHPSERILIMQSTWDFGTDYNDAMLGK